MVRDSSSRSVQQTIRRVPQTADSVVAAAYLSSQDPMSHETEAPNACCDEQTKTTTYMLIDWPWWWDEAASSPARYTLLVD